MSGRVEWQPVTVGEVVVRYADFTDQLASGESVESAAATVTVWSGDDPSPQTTVAPTIVLQENSAGVTAIAAVTINGGVLGTIYAVFIQAVTSAENKPIKAAYLAIISGVP